MYKKFVLGNRQNLIFLRLALASVLAEWIIFKIAYPFPDFFSDSYGYIRAAMGNWDINIWPVGYSKFLYFFHKLTHSDTILVTFQYFILELSAIHFFYTIRYFYEPGKKTSIILFFLLFCNPMFLYISNYVTSDSLFCSLTILWITELLWIMQRPQLWRIIPQAVLIFLAFTLRYNAIYYPIITAVAFSLSRYKLWIKFVGPLLVIFFIIPFLNYSRNAGKALTGTPIYSILGGWQLANNALYFYGQIHVDSTKLPTQECIVLDSITKEFYKTAQPGYMDFLAGYVGNYFIQQGNAPLKKYMSMHYKHQSVYTWGMVSPLFATYGGYLIRTNPSAYLRYFVLMNTKNYFLPPLEKLKTYNMGQDTVWEEARYWFQYPTTQVQHPQSDFQEQLLFIFSPLFLIINIFFPFSVIWYFVSKAYKQKTDIANKGILLVSSFWLINFLFSITANIIALRYELFPLILIFSFSLILYEQFPKNTNLKK